MDNEELEHLLQVIVKNNKNICVIARDEIDKIYNIKLPAFVSLCTSDSTEKFGHWLLFYIFVFNNEVSAYYFDSFGEPLHRYNITFPFRIVKYNRRALQHDSSDFCGKYVLLVSYYLTRLYSFETVLNLFSSNRLENDNIVERFYKLLSKFNQKRKIKNKTYFIKCISMCETLKKFQNGANVLN